MKSEVRNLNEKTKGLPFPKLMITDNGTIILATCVEAGDIAGAVVHGGGGGIGFYAETWNIRNLKDLPEGVEVVLSNNNTD